MWLPDYCGAYHSAEIAFQIGFYSFSCAFDGYLRVKSLTIRERHVSPCEYYHPLKATVHTLFGLVAIIFFSDEMDRAVLREFVFAG